MPKLRKGESISAERINASALKISQNRQAVLNGSTYDQREFSRNAICYADIQMKIGPGSKVLEVPELRGDKITGRAHLISDPELFRRSGGHKGNRVELRGAAYCVIDVSYSWVK